MPRILGCLAVFSVLLMSVRVLPQYRAKIEEEKALRSCQIAILSRLHHLGAALIAAPTKQNNGALLTFTWTSDALQMRNISDASARPAVCKFDLKTRQVTDFGFD
jgi:hypothetical protein